MSTWSMNGLTAGMVSIRFETKYLRLRTPVTIGSRFGEWEVCCLGGWTSHKLSYIVMTARVPRKTTLENRVRIVKALQRRLQRLERHGHDSSGLVPHTQEWHEYWHEGICAYASDDYQGARRALSAEPFLNRNSFIGAPKSVILQTVLNQHGSPAMQPLLPLSSDEGRKLVYRVEIVRSYLVLLQGNAELRLYESDKLHDPNGIDETFADKRRVVVILEAILNVKQDLHKVFANLSVRCINVPLVVSNCPF